MLNSIVPRQIKQSNLSPGTWFLASQYLPPDGIEVLCCSEFQVFWVDIYSAEHGWANGSKYRFAWQFVSTPLAMFWELD